MDKLEFGQMVTFDQGYGEFGVVLDDKGDTITLMAHGEEPHEHPVIARSQTGIVTIHDNWDSMDEALALAKQELAQVILFGDGPDSPCKYDVGEFVTTALIGKWKIYPRPEPGVPAGVPWRDICRGAVKYLTEKLEGPA